MPTWSFTRTELDRSTERHQLLLAGAPASFDVALTALAEDVVLRETLLAALRQCAFAAFFWETPPITGASLNRAFEFVVLDAPGLGRTPADHSAFREHLDSALPDAVAVAFPSLRRDALLIAPARMSDATDYGHLAAFVRSASAEQQHGLLRLVARSTRERAASTRTWLSTAGLGVAWLHVRLDSVPKYYRFADFRDH